MLPRTNYNVPTGGLYGQYGAVRKQVTGLYPLFTGRQEIVPNSSLSTIQDPETKTDGLSDASHPTLVDEAIILNNDVQKDLEGKMAPPHDEDLVGQGQSSQEIDFRQQEQTASNDTNANDETNKILDQQTTEEPQETSFLKPIPQSPKKSHESTTKIEIGKKRLFTDPEEVKKPTTKKRQFLWEKYEQSLPFTFE